MNGRLLQDLDRLLLQRREFGRGDHVVQVPAGPEPVEQFPTLFETVLGDRFDAGQIGRNDVAGRRDVNRERIPSCSQDARILARKNSRVDTHRAGDLDCLGHGDCRITRPVERATHVRQVGVLDLQPAGLDVVSIAGQHAVDSLVVRKVLVSYRPDLCQVVHLPGGPLASTRRSMCRERMTRWMTPGHGSLQEQPASCRTCPGGWGHHPCRAAARTSHVATSAAGRQHAAHSAGPTTPIPGIRAKGRLGDRRLRVLCWNAFRTLSRVFLRGRTARRVVSVALDVAGRKCSPGPQPHSF